MKWRDHVWSKGKYADAVTPSGCHCRRCGVSYDAVAIKPQRWFTRDSVWRCRFNFKLGKASR